MTQDLLKPAGLSAARHKDMGDGTYAEIVAAHILSSPDANRELVVSTYVCKTSFDGADVGDTITCTQILDVTDSPSTVSVLWRNQTQGADLDSSPDAASITLVGASALTNAELRAAPLDIDLPADAATVTAQNSQTEILSNVEYNLGARADAAASSDTGTFSLIAFIKRALQNWTTLLSRLPSLISSRLPVASSLPYAATAPVLMSAQTSAGGTAFVSFGSQACDSLELLVTDATTHAIGVAIEYKINGTGTALPLFYGDSDLITGLTNANQISVRRVDQSTTQIYVYAKAHTL